MVTATFEIPTLYGDHHVIEIRKLLSPLPGIENIYASSCFHTVEVQFDEGRLTTEAIKAQLAEAGYLGELPIPVERGTDRGSTNGNAYFRHAAAMETTPVVSFVQQLPFTGRPLWPCPGLNKHQMEEEVTHG
ncbi:MAG: heavy-metal-associated domain-containing protein [Chloroflexi bacterium]|nr:heavy-metal-associated domain-containing protein [Chloroflexota bacterium]MBP8056899.1 heavy-metal-associated domain-containing protein [Chloroflexota bacterium]